MASFLHQWLQASRRFLLRLPSLLGAALLAVAHRRRWQLVATLVVGVVLGAVAVGTLGLHAGDLHEHGVVDTAARAFHGEHR